MRKTDLTYLVEILSKHLKAASVHFRVEELQLCLLSCPTDISALSVVQAYTCLGAKANEDINNKLDMLKYWYRKKSIKGLLTMMKASTKDISAILDKFNNQLEAMMDAQKVPIVWINNRSFPSCYSLTDFPYVLLDLCMIYSQEEKI